MYLIVGLGNPDKIYHNTYHNAGFLCLDRVAERLSVEFNKGECRAVTAHARVNGEKVILAKPITYMNLSGESLLELVNKYKIPVGKLLVVYDDVDLKLGSLRIRREGGAGTHNGMRSIVGMLGTENFVRVRLGIGQETRMELADFVLSKITEENRVLLNPVFLKATEAICEFVNGLDVEELMQKFNKKAIDN